MRTEKWNVEELCGYKPQTTFWNDFCIAEKFGEKAIKETFNIAFEEWKGNVVYLTELAMVMNHKVWRFYGTNDAYARLYNTLWEKVDGYACRKLSDKDLTYYLRTTD